MNMLSVLHTWLITETSKTSFSLHYCLSDFYKYKLLSYYSIWERYLFNFSIKNWHGAASLVQFSSVTQSCLSLWDPIDCSTPGLPVHHQLSEFTQTHVHWVSDAIQPPHPLLSPSPPTFNLSQHQGLFKWVSPLHQVAKVLEFQLHQ